MSTIIRFMDLPLVALLVGAMFGIDPVGLSTAPYIELQQHTIPALNTSMPILGAVCILFTMVLAVSAKGNRTARSLPVAAVVCLVVAGVVTRFANQPINSQVMTWNIQAPPTNWMDLRDQRRHWHIVVTLAGTVALCLLIWDALYSRGRPR